MNARFELTDSETLIYSNHGMFVIFRNNLNENWDLYWHLVWMGDRHTSRVHTKKKSLKK
jgi:hypothetical protein